MQVRPGSQEEQVGRLILAAVVVTALPNVPVLGYAFYPFAILVTWFHEMGHGLTGLLLGFDFHRLVILPDGSGLAQSRGGPAGAVPQALVAAGGPLAPSFVGGLLILASSRHEWWRPALLALAAMIALSVVIWVRSATGLVVLPLVAAGLVWLVMKGRVAWQRPALQFLGVLAALSMFGDWRYLFTETVVVGGQVMLSDTGQIERALLLPHWFWAVALIAIAGLVVGTSLKFALARDG
ncbi:M50 family peptidase [Erythrobacter arachoides]|uniref:M50 family peptidase n=1 Tax=Aurantiacibacter arachoides TaxID=1850444 RepID=A0A844ZWE6_9SPHN|nr:M50 family metallopeptidase [Aurantiacibacter arachoides]MXO92058.1 M50 family peptidase [Aurantiacibacter arachoides]GGD60096.1 peptidase M50 [Aurantiacibacter arachoides]